MNATYHLSPNYTGVEIWIFDPATMCRVGVFKSVPKNGLNRRERYGVLAEKIRDHGMPVPPYDMDTR